MATSPLPPNHERRDSATCFKSGYDAAYDPDNKPWQFDDTSDEDYPQPTQKQTFRRRARAQEHVHTKLLLLHAEQLRREDLLYRYTSLRYDQNGRASSSPPLTTQKRASATPTSISTLGPISFTSSTWRSILSTDSAPDTEILDRRYLHDLNAQAFTQSGLLRPKLISMERPSKVPSLYWKWLCGKQVRGAEDWAYGWTAEGPSIEWIERWERRELSSREMYGREKRVSFSV